MIRLTSAGWLFAGVPVWPKYSNPLPTDHQNYRPNYLNIDLASL